MNINVDHLIKVLGIQTASNDDKIMLNYIKQYVTGMKLRYTQDDYGNLYVTKGTKNYIGLVCHTDTVHSIVKELSIINYKNQVLFGFGKRTEENRFEQLGCGGDDKVGVYICLQALKDLPDIKCVFYRNEEIGHLGSNASNIEYLKDCAFIVQCDRRENSDFIDVSRGIKICSDAFLDAAKPIYEKYGYKKCIGCSTDVDTLVERGLNLSCVNLSCGYYLPHTDKTFVLINEVENCYKLVIEMYGDLRTTKFEHQYEKPTYNKPTYNTNTYGYCDSNMFSYSKKSCRFQEKFNFIEKDSRIKIFDLVDYPLEYQDIQVNYAGEVQYDRFKPNADFTEYCYMDKWYNSETMMKFVNKDYMISVESVYDELEVINTNYVYSRLHEGWLKLEDCKWVEEIGTYIFNDRT